MSKAEEATAPPTYEQSGPGQPVPPQYAGQQQGYPPQQQGYPPQQQGYPPQQGYAPQNQPQAYPQYQYTPAPGQVVVVQNQTPYSGPVPDDHCTFSILNTIFCCFWIGIFAIIKSQSVRDAVNRGDMHRAAQLSKEVKKLNHIALGLGIAFNVIYIGLVVVYCIFVAGAFYY